MALLESLKKGTFEIRCNTKIMKSYTIRFVIAVFAFFFGTALVSYAQDDEVKVKKLKKDERYLYERDTTIMKDPEHIYVIENLGENVNSAHAESGPRISPDGKTLYFFRIDGKGHYAHTRDIWFSEFNSRDCTWSEAQHAPKPLNNYGDNSVHSVMKDGNALLLHNKYLKNGTTENGLSVSFRKRDGSWSFPEELKIDHYNNDTICSFHMDNDMKVLILAIRQKKDTYGKQDLYVSFRKHAKDSLHWTKPMNLGEVVNSAETEATAFLDVDLKTLYFSTNGRERDSYGGFDIYKTTRLDSTWEVWSYPENIGEPFNTTDDEFYYSLPHVLEYAYMAHHFMASDTTEHSDLVRIHLKPNHMVTLVGKVYDDYSKEVIEAKIIFRKIYEEEVVGELEADTVDGYTLDLPVRKKYKYVVSSEGYQTLVDSIDLTNVLRPEEKTMDIFLKRNPALVLSGTIKDKKSGEEIPGTIQFKRISDGAIVYTKKLEKGEAYDVKLPAGISYEYTVTTELRYIPEVNEIDLVSLKEYKEDGQDMFLNPRDVVFEIEDIFFETAKYNLLPESFKSLDNLVKVLNEVPDLKVEISGHTDWVGDDAYNEKLSQNRAQSVVDYLIEHGIDKEKLEAKGYGETQPRATNKTPEGRQQNRRVEFKALN